MDRYVIIEFNPHDEIMQVVEHTKENRIQFAKDYGLQPEDCPDYDPDWWWEGGTDDDAILRSEGPEKGARMRRGYYAVIKQVFPVVQA